MTRRVVATAGGILGVAPFKCVFEVDLTYDGAAMVEKRAQRSEDLLDRYHGDIEKVVALLALGSSEKLRGSLTDLLAKLARENAVPGLAAVGFDA
jgi:hypothetical protein